MIAYDAAGTTLVLGDDAELLVHDGPSEGPRWRCTLAAPLIAVGATANAVIAVDRAGAVRWYDPQHERVLAIVEVGAPVLAAAVAADGQVLVATDAGASVLAPGRRVHGLEWPHARVVACGPGRYLVGDEHGKLGEFDAQGLLHSVQLEAPAVSATWNPRGFWVVATAHKLLRVVDGAVHHLTNSPDMVVGAVACSGDGAAIGMQLGDALVLVMSWPERDTIGQIRYLDRNAASLAFGPAPWLGIGLVGGDGNKFNLMTGDLHRTDTQPGRPHRSWTAKLSVHPPESAAAAPAAGQPASRGAYAPPTPLTTPANTGKRMAWILVEIAAIVLVANLFVRC